MVRPLTPWPAPQDWTLDEKIEYWLTPQAHPAIKDGYCEISAANAKIILKRIEDLKKAYLHLFEAELKRYEDEGL